MSGAQSLAGTPTPTVDVPTFAFHIDVLLLSLFALYVVSTLPRALVRLFYPSEILNGFFLHSGAQRTPPIRRNNSTRTILGQSDTGTISKGYANAPPVHHSSGAHLHSDALGEDSKVGDAFPALFTPVVHRIRGARQSAATARVPHWTTIFHHLLAYGLNVRVSPGFSFGQLLVLLAYVSIVLYACLFRSDPLSDPNRMAYIAVSQIPIVVALANKSSWLSWLSGVGYEKVNIDELHRAPFRRHSFLKANPV